MLDKRTISIIDNTGEVYYQTAASCQEKVILQGSNTPFNGRTGILLETFPNTYARVLLLDMNFPFTVYCLSEHLISIN